MLRNTLLIILFVLPVALWAQDNSKNTQNTTLPDIDYKQMGAPMPSFAFFSYNDTTTTIVDEKSNKKKRRKKSKTPTADTSTAAYSYIDNKELNNGANLLIMMFNPTCLHCEDVTFMLEKNIELFKKSKVLLLANKVMCEYVPDFSERHHVGRYPSMYIGYDTTQYIEKVFLYQTLPQINIYNAERKLIKTYTGEVPIDTLKKYIQ